jgi:hypothetical protein
MLHESARSSENVMKRRSIRNKNEKVHLLNLHEVLQKCSNIYYASFGKTDAHYDIDSTCQALFDY